MIDTKDFDSWLADHQLTVARVGHDAWEWQTSAPAGNTNLLVGATAFATIRRHARIAVSRAGQWLLPPHPGTEARS